MIDIIAIIASSFFDMFLIIIYYSKMFSERKKPVSNVMFYSGFILVEILINIYYELIFNSMDESMSAIRTLITILFSLFTLYMLTLYYSVHIAHRLFVIISFQFYCNIGEFFVFKTIDSYLSSSGTDIVLDDYIFNLLSKIVCFFMIIITILIVKRNNTNYTIPYSILIISTPIISILTIIALSFSESISFAFHIIRFVSIIGLLIFNITNFYLLDHIILTKELRFKEQTLTRQIDYQAEKYDLIRESYRDTRRIIHDTKTHYMYIRGAIERHEYDSLINYIDKQIDTLDNKSIRVNSGNLAIDSLVSSYIQIAEHDGIPFETKIRITPKEIDIDNYDMCVILGNLLENSINASRKISSVADRHILLEAYTTATNFILHISNSINASDEPKLKKEINDSFSPDVLNHGYGIENVKNIVAKYPAGVFSYFIEKGEYNSIIIIPNLENTDLI